MFNVGYYYLLSEYLGGLDKESIKGHEYLKDGEYWMYNYSILFKDTEPVFDIVDVLKNSNNPIVPYKVVDWKLEKMFDTSCFPATRVYSIRVTSKYEPPIAENVE